MSFTKRAGLVLVTVAAAATVAAGAASAAPAADVSATGATAVHGNHKSGYKPGYRGQGHKARGPHTLGAKVGYLIDHPDRAAKYLDRAVKHLLKHGSA